MIVPCKFSINTVLRRIAINLVLLVTITLLAQTNVNGQPKGAKPGKSLPEIALPDTSGIVQRLSAQSGKIVLVDFWASWCGPCRASNPALVKIYDEYHSKAFEIYGVSLDKSPNAWKSAINTDHIRWLQVNDNGNSGPEGTAAWQIRYIPTSILLDKSGKIVAFNPTVKQLKSYLRKHLN
ncbi:MAG: TlpA family protein disulfide reductase [Chitinophagaceae bacterium]|nr:MAG: TlpA family protein disulfide reductase [Chitinophagaceae bacterium]